MPANEKNGGQEKEDTLTRFGQSVLNGLHDKHCTEYQSLDWGGVGFKRKVRSDIWHTSIITHIQTHTLAENIFIVLVAYRTKTSVIVLFLFSIINYSHKTFIESRTFVNQFDFSFLFYTMHYSIRH